MAHLLTVMFTAAELDDFDLIRPTVAFYGCGYFSAFDQRSAYCNLFAIGNQQNLFKVYGSASIDGQFLDLQGLPLAYPVLFTTGFYDCIHFVETPKMLKCQNYAPGKGR